MLLLYKHNNFHRLTTCVRFLFFFFSLSKNKVTRVQSASPSLYIYRYTARAHLPPRANYRASLQLDLLFWCVLRANNPQTAIFIISVLLFFLFSISHRLQWVKRKSALLKSICWFCDVMTYNLLLPSIRFYFFYSYICWTQIKKPAAIVIHEKMLKKKKKK